MGGWTDRDGDAKYSLPRYAVRCLPLATASERIRQAARPAVERVGEIQPGRFEPPITLEADLNERQVAWYVSWMPPGQVQWRAHRLLHGR